MDSNTHTHTPKPKRNVRSRCCVDAWTGKGGGGRREKNIPGIGIVHHFSLGHSFNLDVLSQAIRTGSLQNCQRLKFTTDISELLRTPNTNIKHVPCLLVYVLQCRRQPRFKRQTVSGPHRLARHSDVHVVIIPVKTTQLRGNTLTRCRLPQQVSV